MQGNLGGPGLSGLCHEGPPAGLPAPPSPGPPAHSPGPSGVRGTLPTGGGHREASGGTGRADSASPQEAAHEAPMAAASVRGSWALAVSPPAGAGGRPAAPRSGRGSPWSPVLPSLSLRRSHPCSELGQQGCGSRDRVPNPLHILAHSGRAGRSHLSRCHPLGLCNLLPSLSASLPVLLPQTGRKRGAHDPGSEIQGPGEGDRQGDSRSRAGGSQCGLREWGHTRALSGSTPNLLPELRQRLKPLHRTPRTSAGSPADLNRASSLRAVWLWVGSFTSLSLCCPICGRGTLMPAPQVTCSAQRLGRGTLGSAAPWGQVVLAGAP